MLSDSGSVGGGVVGLVFGVESAVLKLGGILCNGSEATT